uniref:Protein max n=1 Tax=Equus asinus TaxID=9793 RepID=A0A9L0K3W8_EQUAS
MSDNDDIEVESDEEQPRFQSAADKRAHHNALERKRRDHIKDSFHSLRDSVPSLQGEKASRAQILDKATEYIQYMRRKNHTHQQDIDDLKRQNALLEQQVKYWKLRSSAGRDWLCKLWHICRRGCCAVIYNDAMEGYLKMFQKHYKRKVIN